MKELINYLIQNKLNFSEIDEEFININNEKYSLVLPNEEGMLFSEDFILITEEKDCDKYVYNFGEKWYWENKLDYDSPKLNELKYLGKAVSIFPTNKSF